MKTNTTSEQIKTIIAALSKLHIFPFEVKSSDPKYNAQRNKALEISEALEIDLVKHYTDALKSQLSRAVEKAAEIETALNMVNP